MMWQDLFDNAILFLNALETAPMKFSWLNILVCIKEINVYAIRTVKLHPRRYEIR